MWDAFIPDGPMHPVDAGWALTAGLAVALVAWRGPRRWLLMVPAAFVAVVGWRPGAELIAGYTDRPWPLGAIVVTIVVVGLAAARPIALSTAAPATVAACAGVWLVAPDTETALIGGVLVAGACVGIPRNRVTRLAALLVAIPVIGAAVGTVGRPERLPTALIAGALFAAPVVAIAMGVGRWRAQRAGTPTTVSPAGTSSITTAPAPTTAS